MLKLLNLEPILVSVKESVGVAPTLNEHDHHTVEALGRSVLIANAQNGDWLCKDVTKPHWHQDDNKLYIEFVRKVAALLKGEKACNECP
jgi:hypothetical protein